MSNIVGLQKPRLCETAALGPSYLNELCLVVAVSVPVDALSQQSVKLLQPLHLRSLCLIHDCVQETLQKTEK